MEGLIGVAIGSIITGIITWTTTKQRTLADLINVDKQIESSYRQQRTQLEATAKTTQQQIHAQVILAERMKWIQNLRDSIVEMQVTVAFLAASLGTDEDPQSREESRAALRSQIALTTKIGLLLNPNEEDHLELQELLRKATTTQRDFPTNQANVPAIMADITMTAQKILKREWERVKKGD